MSFFEEAYTFYSDFVNMDAELSLQICILGENGNDTSKLLSAFSQNSEIVNASTLPLKNSSSNIDYASSYVTIDNVRVLLKCWEIINIDPIYRDVVAKSYVHTSNTIILLYNIHSFASLQRLESLVLPSLFDNIFGTDIPPLNLDSFSNSSEKSSDDNPDSKKHSKSSNSSQFAIARSDDFQNEINRAQEVRFRNLNGVNFSRNISPQNGVSPPLSPVEITTANFPFRAYASTPKSPTDSTCTRNQFSTPKSTALINFEYSTEETPSKLVLLFGCTDPPSSFESNDRAVLDSDLININAVLKRHYFSGVKMDNFSFGETGELNFSNKIKEMASSSMDLRFRAAMAYQRLLSTVDGFCDEEKVEDALMELGYRANHVWWVKHMPKISALSPTARRSSRRLSTSRAILEQEIEFNVRDATVIGSMSCCTLS